MVEGIDLLVDILGSEKAAVWDVNFQFRFRQDEQDLLDFFFPQFPDETEEPHSACAVIQYTLSGKILFYRIAWIIFFCVVHLGRQKNNYPADPEHPVYKKNPGQDLLDFFPLVCSVGTSF